MELAQLAPRRIAARIVHRMAAGIDGPLLALSLLLAGLGLATLFSASYEQPGRVIAQASHDKEEILTAVCDPKIMEQTRRWWPFLRDRRIDAYGDITKRFGN